MNRYAWYALAASAAVAIASPSWAATTVKVTEGGEGGGPMTLTLDQTTIKAGETIFAVHNDAMTEEHEMVLVKLKSPDQKIPVIASRHRVDEKQLKSIGEVSDLKPGADGQLKAKLAPGAYLLLCNIKGHYEAGMQAGLTVTR
ncbi:copper resistance protein [Rhizobium sp. R72]|uniref:plastocyanin/azurin family copper-binding protein n=1 Tax=unclassified Rhizobium TaxID=2613769 RepID=UPI000B53078D|nr:MULTISPECIES: plastocyanin/azurin family copper-binding protein [unclassified Rhizobium]OWV96715.1 copper resistance protein [Rhizobium sp. R693]OWW05276.1 copper resistance protein [Rhizobium sp. R72]OWW06333.1 copper resistance protein [Rhizobium sp. R711]